MATTGITDSFKAALLRDAPSTNVMQAPADLTDDELVPYYNEYMRRKMQRRRKEKK